MSTRCLESSAAATLQAWLKLKQAASDQVQGSELMKETQAGACEAHLIPDDIVREPGAHRQSDTVKLMRSFKRWFAVA